MHFLETKLNDVWLIEPEQREDERGFFARTWCTEEAAAHGLRTTVAQCNISFNQKRGTLRGMHYQAAPYEEAKLVRCTMGAIYDVAVDLRPGSATFRQWVSAELTANSHRMLYIPEGCAHGFLTLEDETEVFYQMFASFHPESARGVRWDDPAFGISWPFSPTALSDKDRSYSDFDPRDLSLGNNDE